MSEPKPHDKASDERLGAAVLMTIGALIFTLCGLCTTGWLLTYGSGQELTPNDPSDLVLALFFGGVPIASGAFLFVIGLRRYRRNLSSR